MSYTQADRAWAEWIAWQLDKAGQRVVLQAWDFGPGNDWVYQMHNATATARRTIAVLSGPLQGIQRRGVLAGAMDQRTVRLVTHHDVSADDCRRAAAALRHVLTAVGV